MMTFDRHVIGALVRHQQLPPGALGAPFYDIPPDPAYVQQVAQWHQGQPTDAKLTPQALALLAAPDLVADIRSLTGRDSMVHTWAMSRADCQPGPLLLAAAKGDQGKQLSIQEITSREELADTILLWLVGAGEPSEPEMHVQMSHSELAVLLSLIDLYSRAKFSAFLAHRAQESSFDFRYIQQAFEEGTNSKDPRWLLGFALPLLDESVQQLDRNAIWQNMHLLAQRKLIEPLTLPNGTQEWRFTLPGEYLAESLHRRTVTVGIDTAAADGQGGLGTHAVMLVRSDDPLWMIDLPPGGNAAIAGVSVMGARQVLDAVLTPAGRAPAARPAEQPRQQSPQAQPPAPPASPAAGYPPHSGYPVQAQPAAAPPNRAQFPQTHSACPVCRQMIAPGTVFCGNCGARLR